MRYILMLMLLMATFTATAGQTLRCGNSLILEGDSGYRVVVKCGKPIYREDYRIDIHTTVRSLYYSFGQTIRVVKIKHGLVFEINTLRRM